VQAEESLKRLYGAEYCSQQETLLIREEQHRKKKKIEVCFFIVQFLLQVHIRGTNTASTPFYKRPYSVQLNITLCSSVVSISYI
jgi:hypothetical protein